MAATAGTPRPSTPRSRPRTARARHLLAHLRAAVPDAHWTIEEQIAEGEVVVTRGAVRGTQRGPLLGIAPTGKQATVAVALISRFDGERVAAYWALVDLLGLLAQLGVLPAMELERAVAVAQALRAGAVISADPV